MRISVIVLKLPNASRLDRDAMAAISTLINTAAARERSAETFVAT